MRSHGPLTCSAGTRTQLVKYGLLVSSKVTKASSWCRLLSLLVDSLDREQSQRGSHGRGGTTRMHHIKKGKTVFEMVSKRHYPGLCFLPQAEVRPQGQWRTRWLDGSPRPAYSLYETPTACQNTRTFNTQTCCVCFTV